MKSLLTDPEELQVTHCNIRKEEEVNIVDLKVTTFVQIQQYYSIVTKSFSEICQIDNVIYHWRTNLQQLFLLPFQLWEKTSFILLQIQNMVSTAISRFCKLDFLVNNAGGQFMSPAEKISLKGWNAIVETNLTGTCVAEKVQHFIRIACWNLDDRRQYFPKSLSAHLLVAYNQHMKEHGGSIVNIVVDMFKGFPSMRYYS